MSNFTNTTDKKIIDDIILKTCSPYTGCKDTIIFLISMLSEDNSPEANALSMGLNSMLDSQERVTPARLPHKLNDMGFFNNPAVQKALSAYESSSIQKKVDDFYNTNAHFPGQPSL